MGLFERTRLARWRRSTICPATGLVLEIGAGTGLDFGYYVSGTTVIATDPDAGMLERARHKAATAAATVLLVAADAEALPFSRGTFDVGVGGLVLCTIPHPGRALVEVHRVLKRGASLRLLEHVRMPNRWVARIQATLTPIWMRIARGCHLDRDAVEIVTRAGFELESVVSHAGGYVVEIVGRPLPPREDRGMKHVLKAVREPSRQTASYSDADLPLHLRLGRHDTREASRGNRLVLVQTRTVS